jgi:hypothetical protein
MSNHWQHIIKWIIVLSIVSLVFTCIITLAISSSSDQGDNPNVASISFDDAPDHSNSVSGFYLNSEAIVHDFSSDVFLSQHKPILSLHDGLRASLTLSLLGSYLC